MNTKSVYGHKKCTYVDFSMEWKFRLKAYPILNFPGSVRRGHILPIHLTLCQWVTLLSVFEYFRGGQTLVQQISINLHLKNIGQTADPFIDISSWHGSMMFVLTYAIQKSHQGHKMHQNIKKHYLNKLAGTNSER